MRSNFSLRNSSTLSVFHLRMLSSSAMFPLSSKSFSTGSEPRTYYEKEGHHYFLFRRALSASRSKPKQFSLTKFNSNIKKLLDIIVHRTDLKGSLLGNNLMRFHKK